jgi:hypothetical protein
MARTPEGKMKDRVSKILRKHGAYYFMPVQSRFGTHTLDFLVSVPPSGYFLAIETKAKATQTYSPRQDLCREEVEASGGMVMLINNQASLDDLDEWLDHIKET